MTSAKKLRVIFSMRSFLTRLQQVSWNNLGQLSNIGRRYAKRRRGISRVAFRLVKRPCPEPLQKRNLCISKQRNLCVRQDEVVFLVERVDLLPRSLNFFFQLA